MEEKNGEKTKKIQNTGEETVKIEIGQEERAATAIRAVKAAYLLAIDGPFFGKKFLLKPDITKIGRERQFNDIVLEGDTVASRRHAVIEIKGGEYVIYDKRSRNRTFVNQKEVKQDEEIVLHPGDEIEIGQNIFRFCLEGKLDFSPPRKGGTIIKKWKYRIFWILSFFILFVSGMKYKNFRYNVSILAQKPSHLNISVNPIDENNENPIISIGNCDNEGGLDIPIVKDGRISLFDLGKGEKIWESNIDNVKMAYTANFILKSKSLDVICHTANPSIVVINGKSGVERASTASLLSGNLTNPSACVDLNGDGIEDVVVVSREGALFILTYGNSNLNLTGHDEVGNNVYSSPVLVSTKEGMNIFIGMGRYLYVYDTMGRMLNKIDLNEKCLEKEGSSPNPPIDVRATPLIVSAKDKKKMKIGIFPRGEQFIELNYPEQNIAAVIKSKMKKGTPDSTGSPVGADMNGDGWTDIIIPSYQEDKIKAINGKDGKVLWEYKGEGGFLNTPALADVNKDNIPDVIVGDEKGYVYIINGKNGNEIYKKKLSNMPIEGSAAVGDIYGDNHLGIVVQDDKGTLYILKTNAKVFHDEVIWSGFMGSPARVGVYQRNAPTLLVSKKNMNISLFIFILTIVGDFSYWFNRRRKVQR